MVFSFHSQIDIFLYHIDHHYLILYNYVSIKVTNSCRDKEPYSLSNIDIRHNYLDIVVYLS